MIYVITHTMFDESLLDQQLYRVLHVGAGQECGEKWLRDDTGDNISSRNNSWCELTGLYWIWKNAAIDSEDITGLVHYRRYFTTVEEERVYCKGGSMPTLLSRERIRAEIDAGRVILPTPMSMVTNVRKTYAREHYVQDLDLVGSCIHELAPSYDKAFQKVMRSHHLSYWNMFLSNRRTLERYCEWLFPILFAVDNRMQSQHVESRYQQRVIGFLAERLLNVWIAGSGVSVAYYPVFNTQERGMTTAELLRYRLRILPEVLSGRYRRRED